MVTPIAGKTNGSVREKSAVRRTKQAKKHNVRQYLHLCRSVCPIAHIPVYILNKFGVKIFSLSQQNLYILTATLFSSGLAWARPSCFWCQIPYSFARTHLIGYDLTTRANHVARCKRGNRHWREVQMINLSASLIIFGVHLYIDFLEEGVNEEKLFKCRGCSHANKLFLMKHHVFFLLIIFYLIYLYYSSISFTYPRKFIFSNVHKL